MSAAKPGLVLILILARASCSFLDGSLACIEPLVVVVVCRSGGAGEITRRQTRTTRGGRGSTVAPTEEGGNNERKRWVGGINPVSGPSVSRATAPLTGVGHATN